MGKTKNRVDTDSRDEELTSIMSQFRGSPTSYLDLAEHDIEEGPSIKIIADGFSGTNISQVDLDGNEINTISAVSTLSKGLSGANIKDLSLASNYLGKSSDQVEHVIDALMQGLSKVRTLSLADNELNEPEELLALSEGIKSTSVSTLDISGNNITSPKAVEKLMEGFVSSNITCLNLTRNKLCDDEGSVEALVKGLPNTNIKELILSSVIGYRGAGTEAIHKSLEMLSEGLSGTPVKRLDFSFNHLRTDTDLKAISKALSASSLNKLNLSNNQINSEAAINILSQGIQGSRLSHINLANNCIGDDAADALVTLLAENNNISDIVLEGNDLSSAQLQKINEQLAINRTRFSVAATSLQSTMAEKHQSFDGVVDFLKDDQAVKSDQLSQRNGGGDHLLSDNGGINDLEMDDVSLVKDVAVGKGSS